LAETLKAIDGMSVDAQFAQSDRRPCPVAASRP
jgi:hypothetical protein